MSRYYLVLLGLLLFSACSRRGGNEMIHFDSLALRNGDIVFRKGVGHKSDFVIYADTGGVYSHVGIVVQKDSNFMVIHITPGEAENKSAEDTIKMESLNNFFSSGRAEAGAIMRLKDDSTNMQASKYALRILEKKILFDHDYSLKDSSKMYCTELLWHAYLSAGRDITQGRRSILKDYPLFSGTYIFPSDIYKNDSLVCIYQF